VNNLSKALVLGVAITLAGCAEDDPQQFIKEGKVFIKNGEMESARVKFQSALQINPKLSEAYYQLALIEEEKQEWTAMKQGLEDVISIDPNHLNAHVKLGFIFRLMGQMDKAKEQSGMALQLDPENIEAILLDGSLLFKKGEKVKALQQVERVLNKDSLNAEAIILKASILLEDKQYDQALTVLNRGIKVYPGNLGMDLLKISVHEGLKSYDGVVRDFKVLVEKHPKDKKQRYRQMQALASIGRGKDAEKALRLAVNDFPEDIDFKLILVNNVEFRDVGEAEKLLKKYIELSPKESRLKSRLADYYIAHNRQKDARFLLNDIVELDPAGKGGLDARVKLAEVAFSLGDKEVAEKTVKEVLAVDINNSNALLMHARIMLLNKDVDSAISNLRIVMRDLPHSDLAMVMMAQAHILKKEVEVAESFWRKAIEVNPNNEAAIIPLVTVMLGRGDYAQAEGMVVKSIKLRPNAPALLELLVNMRVSKKDWVGALVAVNKMKELPQANQAARVFEGMLVARQGRHVEAIKKYQDILSEEASVNEALIAMVRSYKALGHSSELITYLQGFIKKNTESVIARNLLGQAYVLDQKLDDAKNIFAEALEINPKSIPSYKFLAGVFLLQESPGKVVEIYRQGLEVLPKDPILNMNLARHFERMEQYSEAISAYEELLKILPDNDQVVDRLAGALVNAGVDSVRFERALLLVGRFKESKNPGFLDTYGWVEYKAGSIGKAIEALKVVVLAVPDNAVFRYHLGEAYFSVGDMAASKMELEKAISLARKQGDFVGMDKAKELLGRLGQ